MTDSTPAPLSAGAKLRAALAAEKPLQVVGAINAYAARMARGHRVPRALSIGRRRRRQFARACRISASAPWTTCSSTSAASPRRAPCRCWSTRTRAGAARSTSRAPCARSSRRARPACTSKTRCSRKRCGHRPGKEVVPREEMVDRVKAAVDARTDASFVIMARSDALAEPRARRNDRAPGGLRRGGRRRGVPRGHHRPRDVSQGEATR